MALIYDRLNPNHSLYIIRPCHTLILPLRDWGYAEVAPRSAEYVV